MQRGQDKEDRWLRGNVQFNTGPPGRAMLCVLTCDNGRDAPAHNVVEPHGPHVDVAYFCQHAVDMQVLYQGPSEGGHGDIVQEDGDYCAEKLGGEEQAQHAAQGPGTIEGAG